MSQRKRSQLLSGTHEATAGNADPPAFDLLARMLEREELGDDKTPLAADD